MTTLITGGMGFIGLHTARAFLDAGEDVVMTYFQTWREPSFMKDEYHKRVQIEQVDVTDREAPVPRWRRRRERERGRRRIGRASCRERV